jgi:hypothetical protein
MSEQFVQLIDEALATVDGEALDRSRATDRLLDLRIAADSPALVTAVDELLSGLPGRTLVANVWWVDALQGLRILAELEDEKTVLG